MKKPKLLDAHALLSWLQGEQGSEEVRTLLLAAQRGEENLLASPINVGEVYYIAWRRVGREEATRFLQSLPLFPIEVCSVSEQLVWRAAEIKAQTGLSYADCFAVGTALKRGAEIVTGDPDFKQVEQTVEVLWI